MKRADNSDARQPNRREADMDLVQTFDVVVPRPEIAKITRLSFPTISRMQRSGQFPPFEAISPGRRGLRKSTLEAWLAGKRDWADKAA